VRDLMPFAELEAIVCILVGLGYKCEFYGENGNLIFTKTEPKKEAK
jgi:hypothetical protein